VDVDANPQIAAAFQVQSIPSVVAVVGGQPVPLFQGAYPEAQVRAVIDELLAVAAQNGVAGTYAGEGAPAEEAPEAPLPPLHQAAYDALEKDDLDGAARAFSQAIRENPRDEDARAGLAQVELLRRLVPADPSAVLAAAEKAPDDDVDAHLAAADVEVAANHVTEAFERLLRVVRATSGPHRERVRVRLLELFEVVGTTTPEVADARRRLAMALY
jgi:putative thioredoxin